MYGVPSLFELEDTQRSWTLCTVLLRLAWNCPRTREKSITAPSMPRAGAQTIKQLPKTLDARVTKEEKAVTPCVFAYGPCRAPQRVAREPQQVAKHTGFASIRESGHAGHCNCRTQILTIQLRRLIARVLHVKSHV